MSQFDRPQTDLEHALAAFTDAVEALEIIRKSL